VPVRQEEPVLRSCGEARRPALVQRRRARAAQDPPAFACRAAGREKAREDAAAASGQPALDHTRQCVRMAPDRQAACVSPLENDSLLRALAREPVARTPIWL